MEVGGGLEPRCASRASKESCLRLGRPDSALLPDLPARTLPAFNACRLACFWGLSSGLPDKVLASELLAETYPTPRKGTVILDTAALKRKRLH